MTIPSLSTIPTRGSAGFGAAFEALLVSMQTGVIPGMNTAVDTVNAAVAIAIASVAGALVATSTTSTTIGTGSKTVTVATNAASKLFQAGQAITLSSAANSGNYMFGQVTGYTPGTGALVVNVTDTSGAGTLADWVISLSGIKGAPGGVTLNGVETLTNKTLTSPTENTPTINTPNFNNTALTNAKTLGLNGVIDNGNSSTAITIALAAGGRQKVTLTANTTITISTTGLAVGKTTLVLKQDATGGRTVTWAAPVSASRWGGASSTPTPNVSVNGETIVVFDWDGTSLTQVMTRIGAV